MPQEFAELARRENMRRRIRAVQAQRRAAAAAPRSRGRMAATGLFGGARTPALASWALPGVSDANVPLLELPEVRQRAREAALASPIYRAIRRALLDEAIGDTGLVPTAAVTPGEVDATEAQVAEWCAAVDELFERHKDAADVTGRMDWAGLCRVAAAAVFDAGDVFPSFPVVLRDDEVLTRVNLIEAERVDTPHERINDPNIIHGVQIDKWGGPAGFWVWRGHPGAFKAEDRHRRFEYWAAMRAGRLNVLQLYDQERIGQARGVPFLNSALDLIDKVPEYTSVTIDAAEAQTRMSLWLMSQGDPEDIRDALSEDEREVIYEERYGLGIDTVGVNVLPVGDDIKMLGSQHPSAYWDSFVVRLARMVCAVSGVPYSIAFADTAGASFSSMKSERSTFQGTIRAFRRMIRPMCRAWRAHLIYDAWLDGKLPPVRLEDNRAGWLRATWTGPRMGFIDEQKEIAAYEKAVAAGIMSRSEIVSMRGGDRTIEDVIAELAYEQKLADEYGIALSGGKSAAPSVSNDDGDAVADAESEDEGVGEDDQESEEPEEDAVDDEEQAEQE